MERTTHVLYYLPNSSVLRRFTRSGVLASGVVGFLYLFAPNAIIKAVYSWGPDGSLDIPVIS